MNSRERVLTTINHKEPDRVPLFFNAIDAKLVRALGPERWSRSWRNDTMAIYTGLDTLLIDVRDQALLSSIYASKILTLQDSYCMEYLKAYREKKILV